MASVRSLKRLGEEFTLLKSEIAIQALKREGYRAPKRSVGRAYTAVTSSINDIYNEKKKSYIKKEPGKFRNRALTVVKWLLAGLTAAPLIFATFFVFGIEVSPIAMALLTLAIILIAKIMENKIPLLKFGIAFYGSFILILTLNWLLF